MKQFTRIYNVLPLLTMLCLASCASEELNDRLLPAGKYPMTFATAMEGLTQTRATTDNTWAGDEKIAVQVGSEVKQYIPTSSKTATLIGADAANTFYWQTADETKEVSAWYCGDGSTTAEQQYAKQLPTTWTVKTDQSGDGYAASDLLYAMPQKIEYKDRNKQLTFKHLPAKVVINLTKGNGLTEENIQSATVSIVNQAITSGTIDGATGIMAQTTASGKAVITPNNVLTTLEPGYQKSVQAIVVPQKIAAKTKFIKVTIGKNDAARDYYYTTKTDNDANFECGKQYIYNITVTKGKELEVTDQTTVIWKDGIATNGIVAEAKEFIVTCPKGSGVSYFNISNATLQNTDKYTVNANRQITITYLTALKRSRYNLVHGIAKVTTSTNPNGTITLAVSDIRGDLVFSFDEYAEVGDYYYADGTWSPDYTSGSSSAACIGIVFKVGAGTGDDASYYGDKLPKGIRGYVVALEDAYESKCAWGGDSLTVGTSTNQEDYLGYYNSRKIVAKANEDGHLKPDDDKYDYPAMYYISTYGNSFQAPLNSSGWYFPSTGQLSDIYQASNSIKGNVSTANGTWFNLDYYLSSSEYYGYQLPLYHASSFSFGTGKKFWREKDTEPAYIRAILTF